MFQWNDNKIVVTSTIEIVPNHRSTPMVWTPNLQPFFSRRVWVVCTTTKAGRQSMRIYPLRKDSSKPVPAFVFVSLNSPYLDLPHTHLILQNYQFALIRPLKAVYYKAKVAYRRGEMDYIFDNLKTLMSHLYLCNLITDESLESLEKALIKANKLLVKACSTNFEKEAETFLEASYKFYGKVFASLEEEVIKWIN